MHPPPLCPTGFVSSSASFLFSTSGDRVVVHPVLRQQYAMSHYSSCGPWFGSELRIEDRAHEGRGGVISDPSVRVYGGIGAETMVGVGGERVAAEEWEVYGWA